MRQGEASGTQVSVEINSRKKRIQRTLGHGTEAPVARLTRIASVGMAIKYLTHCLSAHGAARHPLHPNYDGVYHGMIRGTPSLDLEV